MIPCEVIDTTGRKTGSQLQLACTLNVVVCPDGLTKNTPTGDWVNTTGNLTFCPHTEQLCGGDPVQCALIC